MIPNPSDGMITAVITNDEHLERNRSEEEYTFKTHKNIGGGS